MRVVFFGDSVCVGQFVAPHATWVNLTCAHLDSKIGSHFSALNASVSGNTTRMALERMPHDVQAHLGEYLLVQFGMNDCNYWITDRQMPRVSPNAFEANLTEIVERALAFGAQRVFLATNHITPRTQPFPHCPAVYQESNERYNKIIRSVATHGSFSSTIILIDHELAWRAALEQGRALDDLLLDDEIHLSRAGHDLYFATAAPIMAQGMGLE